MAGRMGLIVEMGWLGSKAHWTSSPSFGNLLGTLMARLTPKNSWRLLLLVACVVGLIRFYRLGDWSLWYDEAVTVADAWHGAGQYNPFGYELVRLTAGLFGSLEEHVLRLPAALIGWLCVPLTWWCFRRACGDLSASAAALLLALSPWAVYWSQNARFYTMAQASCLLGLGALVRGVAGGGLPLVLLGAVLAFIGFGFHPSSTILAAAIVVACLIVRPGSLRAVSTPRLLFLATGMGLLALPFAGGALREFVAAKDTAGVSSLARLVMSTGFYVTPTLALGALFGSVVAWRESELGRVLCLVPVVVCLAAGGAALLAASSAQYVFVMLPVVCALASWPLKDMRGGARVAWCALLAAPLAAGSTLYFGVRFGERPRWEEAYRHAWDQRGEGDLVIGMQSAVGEYYLNPGETDLRHPTVVGSLDRTAPQLWKAWAGSRRPLWIVVRPAFLALWKPDERLAFEAFLSDQCRLSERFSVPMEGRDLDLEVWRRPRQKAR